MSVIDWIWWSVGSVIGLGGIALTIWAMLADRSRGRRRCSKCWYEMTGIEGLRCPECGCTAKRERRLLRTRRRWRWALLGGLMVTTSWPVAHWPQIRRDGWLSMAPTTALILGHPLVGEHNPQASRSLFIELDSRLVDDSDSFAKKPMADVWDWQWRLLYAVSLARARRNEDLGYYPLHREPGLRQRRADQWMKLALFDAAGKRPEAIDAFVDRFPPWLMVLDPPREHWPENAVLPLRARVIPRWRQDFDYTLDVRLVDPGAEEWLPPHTDVRRPIWFGLDYLKKQAPEKYRPMPAGSHDISYAFDLYLNPTMFMDEAIDPVPLGTFRVDQRITIAGTMDDVVQPVRQRRLDELLEAELRIVKRTFRFGGSGAPMNDFLLLVLDSDTASRFEDICIAFRLAWLRDGVEVAVTDPTVFLPRVDSTGRRYFAADWDSLNQPRVRVVGDRVVADSGPLGAQTVAQKEPGRWALRLIPDQEAALYLSTKDRYWVGDVTIPFEIDRDPGITW